MRYAPFLLIDVAANAILYSTAVAFADTVTRTNEAIAEVNENYEDYGYDASPDLPDLPAVPTGGVALFYSTANGTSETLVDETYTKGYDNPSGSILKLLSIDPVDVVEAIKAARATLDGASE